MNEQLVQKAREKGADAEFLTWVRKWPSCLTGAYSEVVNGEGRCEAAHVRRVSDGAGIAEKPPYSAIPLTHDEHAMQHQKGESIFCPPQWFERQRDKYLTMWINGVRPPMIEEQKAHWKKEYIVEHPGQMVALWLLLKKHFSRAGAPAVKCTIQRAIKQRSNKQNSAQWGLLYSEAKDFYSKNLNALVSDTLKAIKFGVNDDYIHWLFKGMFLKGGSTAKLSTIQSKEYHDTAREYFLHEHGLQMSEPVSPEQQYFNQGE